MTWSGLNHSSQFNSYMYSISWWCPSFANAYFTLFMTIINYSVAINIEVIFKVLKFWSQFWLPNCARNFRGIKSRTSQNRVISMNPANIIPALISTNIKNKAISSYPRNFYPTEIPCTIRQPKLRPKLNTIILSQCL